MENIKIWQDDEVDLRWLAGKTVAVIGYGAQGEAQALNMRDSGLSVIVGGRPGKSADKAAAAGFAVLPLPEAVAKGDILHILLPDERQGEIYRQEIAPYLTAGKILSFSHGFSVVYRQIVAPDGVGVIMVAPKGVATGVRSNYLAGSGVPGLFSVRCGGETERRIALALAKGIGLTRLGVVECTMEQETHQDLFGEQNILCGGMIDLMINAFEVLTEAGYPAPLAYIECIQEAKLLVDLIFSKGIAYTNEVISNTAEWGEYINGRRLIGPEIKEKMRQSLQEIQNGAFAGRWLEEVRRGSPDLLSAREHLKVHPVEEAGKFVRKLYHLDK